MTANYMVHVLDTTGARKAVFDDVRDLTVELNLNGVGNHQIAFKDGDSRITYLDDVADAGVQVWRKGDWSGATWTLVYDGFHRNDEHQITEVNTRIYTSYGRSLEDLLRRRWIQYYASTPQTEKNGPTETVMKEFVRENAGPDATIANGRFREVATPINVQADGATGSTWAGARAHNNLLDVLQELAQFGSVDFAVVRTSGVVFEFRTYFPRYGLDRRLSTGGSNAHVFSPDMGNVSTPSFTKTRTDEVSSVTVLGQGEDEARSFVVEEGGTAGDSPWNDVEIILDSRNEDDATGLDVTALVQLDNGMPRTELVFNVFQTDGSRYGRDYAIGDWITVRFGTHEKDLRISGVTISINDAVETITLKVDDVDTRPTTTSSASPLAQIAASLAQGTYEAYKIPLAQTNPLPALNAWDAFKWGFPATALDFPATPPFGKTRAFVDSDGKLRTIDDAGVISDPIEPGGGGPSSTLAAVQAVVGDGTNLIVADRHNIVDQLPYNFTITEVRAQNVQGEDGDITIDIDSFTPGGTPSYSTVHTITIASDNNYHATGLSILVATGDGLSMNVSGIDVFTEMGVTLIGAKS